MSTRSQPEVYESAIDLWVAVLLFIAPTVATVVGIYLFLDGLPAEAAAMFVTAAVTLLITAGLTLPCRYTLLKDSLSIRCGLICYQIALREIREVAPSASLKSGPALSLRRVAVKTEKRQYLLSPKNRDQFIERLNEVIGEHRSQTELELTHS